MPAHGVCSCHRLFGGALARTAHQRGYATRVFVLSRPRSTTEGIPNRASVLVGTPSVAVAIHVAAADEYNQQTTAFTRVPPPRRRSEEHTSELQSLMRISSAVFLLKNTT